MNQKLIHYYFKVALSSESLFSHEILYIIEICCRSNYYNVYGIKITTRKSDIRNLYQKSKITFIEEEMP